jgi:hypothetical protein
MGSIKILHVIVEYYMIEVEGGYVSRKWGHSFYN